MKKNRLIQWLALALTGALLLCFAACNSGRAVVEPPTEYEPEPETTTEAPTVPTASLGIWRIELRGVPNVLFFSSEDAQYLPKVQIEMTTTNPETGLSSRNTYGGITLRSLLNYCGVQNVASVTVTSKLGPFATYNDVMAMAEDTVLAWEIDGAEIDADPPLRMCPRSSAQPTDFIRQVTSLNVVPAAAALDPGLPEQPGFSDPPMGNNNPAPTTWQTTTTWATYPSSAAGVDPPTTETTTTTTTTTTRIWTTRAYTSYVGPTTTTQNTAKPSWWPDGVPWPPED